MGDIGDKLDAGTLPLAMAAWPSQAWLANTVAAIRAMSECLAVACLLRGKNEVSKASNARRKSLTVQTGPKLVSKKKPESVSRS
jgi:hypothetical protein